MATCLGKSCSFGLPRVLFVNCCQFMYLVVSLLVLKAECGIWLYQFLIIAYHFTFLTLHNRLLKNSQFPEIYKYSHVIPEALLSNVGKGMERIVFKRIYNF